MQFYYVRVIHFLQNLHLSISSLRIDVVPKSPEDFLQSKGTVSYLVLHFPNMTVRSTTHQLSDFVFMADMAIYFF
jgi:hypothetical protein